MADLKWTGPYHVDADHIHLGNVDRFIEASDFFTIDVTNFIGESADASEIEAFVKESRRCFGALSIPGLSRPLAIDQDDRRTRGRGNSWPQCRKRGGFTVTSPS